MTDVSANAAQVIEPAKIQDVPLASEMLAEAFENDENMTYFFLGNSVKRKELAREFFEILMSARVALRMPVFLAKQEGKIAGAVMGYDATRPEWLAEHSNWWSEFQAKQDGLADRLKRQDEALNRFKPTLPHYYLGVLGVNPAFQGKGIGAALIERFFAASDADMVSSGVYIDTANPSNVNYYKKFGFKPAGEAVLDPLTRHWTLFRPAPQLVELGLKGKR